jgi:hypothetical protein
LNGCEFRQDGKFEQKNTFYAKQTHFKKRKNEHKPNNNKELQKTMPDRPKKNKPIFLVPPKPWRRGSQSRPATGFFIVPAPVLCYIWNASN